jgi:rubredoxin
MIRCVSCGRFVPYKDISLGFCKHEHTPDTPFSNEDDSWYCRKCTEKEKEIKKNVLKLAYSFIEEENMNG